MMQGWGACARCSTPVQGPWVQNAWGLVHPQCAMATHELAGAHSLGSDDNPGTLERPMRTLAMGHGARLSARRAAPRVLVR